MVKRTVLAIAAVGIVAFGASAQIIDLPSFPFPFPGGGIFQEPARVEKLKSLGADPSEVTISGVSAGAFVAIQMQVAYSGSIKGAGAIAGGPWNCADGSSSVAQQRCMKTPGDIDLQKLDAEMKREAQAGNLDPLENLKKHRLYVYASPNDRVVNKGVGEKLVEQYSRLMPASAIKVENSIASGHGMPTIDKGNGCTQEMLPWLLKCNYDAAGEMFAHLYGDLKPRAATPGRKLVEFDQTEFSDAETRIANKGFAYIPEACEVANSKCKIHIALHGCQMDAGIIQDRYAREAGYNEWADTNKIIVLYPQAKGSMGNPLGCFDWFGYSGTGYAGKTGPQMKAMKAMIDRLTSARN